MISWSRSKYLDFEELWIKRIYNALKYVTSDLDLIRSNVIDYVLRFIEENNRDYKKTYILIDRAG